MTWQSRAACRDDADPELWFSYDPGEVAAAKAICAACPVRNDCLDSALADEDGASVRDRHGVWGGLTSPERAMLANPDATVVALAPENRGADMAKVYRRLRGEHSLKLNDAERMAVVRTLWSEGLSDRDIQERSGINKRQVFRDRRRLSLPAMTKEARTA